MEPAASDEISHTIDREARLNEEDSSNFGATAIEQRVFEAKSAEIKATQIELEGLKQALRKEEAAWKQEMAKKKAVTLKLKDLEVTLKEKEQSLKAESEDLTDQRLIKQKEIEFIRKQIKDFQAEKVACICEISVLNEELQSHLNTVDEHDAKLDQMKDMIKKLNKEKTKLLQELEGGSLNDSRDSLLSLTEDDEAEYQQRLTNLQYEKLRLNNEREKLEFMLKDSRVQIKIKESRISTLKAEITRYSITTRKEMEVLTDSPKALHEQLAILEAENKQLKGQDVVEQLHALKYLVERQLTENKQLREKLQTAPPPAAVQSGKDLGPVQSSKCNCVVQ